MFFCSLPLIRTMSRKYASNNTRNSELVRLSKSLSYVLRHGAQKAGIPMRTDGYVLVSNLLKTEQFRQYTLADIEHVVKENEKQRFTLTQEADGNWWIKANQGHSLQVDDLELEIIQNADDIPVVIHGTNFGAWDLIEKQGALSKMSRQHIHMASGLPGASGVISGMRASVDVLIYIDAKKAMDAGIVFMRSPNGVILTEGKDGKLSLKYIAKVTNRSGKLLPFRVPQDQPEVGPATVAVPQPAKSTKGKERAEA